MAYKLVAKYSSNGFLQIGACTVGRFIIICYNLLKAVCYISSHSKLCPFLINLAKDEVIEAKPRMNLLMYETFPEKLFNSFTVVGGFMVAMAVAFAGSTSIPLREPRNPEISQKIPQMHI